MKALPHPLQLLLVVGYYLAVVLPHKRFGSFLNQTVFQSFSRDQYNLIIFILATVVLGFLTIVFHRNTRHAPEKRRLWFYWLSSIALALLISRTLFVINIEMIHFPQYALFAILLFPVIGCYNTVLLWSVMAGALDEAYQYFYLAPNDTTYYDFNDVVTNLVGAASGLVFLRSFGIAEGTNCSYFRSKAFYTLLVLLISMIFFRLIGLLSVYPDSNATYQLVRELPATFWTEVPLGYTYHVLSPVEGCVLIMMLLLFYRRIP